MRIYSQSLVLVAGLVPNRDSLLVARTLSNDLEGAPCTDYLVYWFANFLARRSLISSGCRSPAQYSELCFL